MKIEEREESIKWSFRRVGEMNGLEKCIMYVGRNVSFWPPGS